MTYDEFQAVVERAAGGLATPSWYQHNRDDSGQHACAIILGDFSLWVLYDYACDNNPLPWGLRGIPASGGDTIWSHALDDLFVALHEKLQTDVLSLLLNVKQLQRVQAAAAAARARHLGGTDETDDV